MIAKDNMPLATVEKEGFQAFMKVVSPLYKIPCRTTITRLIETKYDYLSSMIKNRLKTIENVCLTTDVWTDTLNTKSYIGVTAHYLLNTDYKSVTIGVSELEESHTAEYLKDWLLKIIKDWNINKENIVVVVSDNANNIKKAIVDAFGSDKHLFCFAHTLNLVPSNVIKKEEEINSLCKKVKSIVTYFKHSVIAADQLRQHSDLKLIQSVETRWNSTYDMLNRFITLADKIGLILLHCPSAPPMITSDELQTIKEFGILLKPFEEATKIICGEAYLTASKVIPVVNILQNTLEKSKPSTKTGEYLKKLLTEELYKRFKDIEYVSLLAIATILDPRFKKIHFRNRLACSTTITKISNALNVAALKQQKYLQTDFESVKNTDDKGDFWSFHENLVYLNNTRQNNRDDETFNDLKYYLNHSTIKMEDSPIKFWNNYPESPISDLAKRYLSIIATSVPSERLFSKAGQILNESRSRLTGKHLQHLLFLNSLSFEDWTQDYTQEN